MLGFNFSTIFKKALLNSKESILYMGSHTTPPCTEYTYHLVMTKPLIMSGCQFNMLRDATLISHKAKNIHARVDKPINDRIAYVFNNSKMKFIKNITKMVPQSFNKFVAKKGFKKKYKIICTPKGCFKRYLNNGQDCTIEDQNNPKFKVDW